MRFKKNNGIECYQDHYTIRYESIPHGIDWSISAEGDTYLILTACGYGEFGRDADGNSLYGNGALTAMATRKELIQAIEGATA